MPIKRAGQVTPLEMAPGVVRVTRIHSEKLMLVEFRLAAGAVVRCIGTHISSAAWF